MHIRSHLAKLFNSKADGPTSPPSYVDFNQPVGVLRSFSETKETLQTQMALKGVEGGKVTHEGFVKEAGSDKVLFNFGPVEGDDQVISDSTNLPILRVRARPMDEQSSLVDQVSSDFKVFALPEEPDDNPVLVIRNTATAFMDVFLNGKFRNSASGVGGMETSEAVEIGVGKKGFSNSFQGTIHVDVQQRQVALITYSQDLVKHPLYEIKIEPKIDSSLIVVCALVHHRMMVDRRGSSTAFATPVWV